MKDATEEGDENASTAVGVKGSYMENISKLDGLKVKIVRKKPGAGAQPPVMLCW